MLHGDGGRREHVIHIVLPEQRAVYGLTILQVVPPQSRSKRVPSGPIICMFSARKSAMGFSPNRYFAFEIAPELADVFIVGIQEGGAGAGQSLDQFVFGAGDARYGFEVLQMHRRDVGDDALIRKRDSRQRGNLASVRHTHFHHGEIVFRFERQQSERETEVIVEISLGAMDAVPDREQMSDRFLSGGLAHGTGDADGGLAP